MSCQELDARFDDWLDGCLSASEVAALEEHLAGCASCREQARKLRRLLAHATALPGSVTPPRDLWPGIERRIARSRGWVALLAWRSPTLLAAAAVLVALAAVFVLREQAGTVGTAEMPVGGADAGAALRPVSGVTEDPVLAQAEREYEAAANALIAALQQRQDDLAPGTIAGVQENLEVIDHALVEVRRALAKDPHNPELNRMLVATHRKKVDVLQRVVRLSTTL
jgi:anti-sigma factor RsiW